MPDSTGFGDYTELRPGHPGEIQGPGGQLHARHVSQRWAADLRRARAVGFSEEVRAAAPRPGHGYAVGTLDYGSVRIATGTMGFKHRALDLKQAAASLAKPNYLLKIIPHVDGTSAHLASSSTTGWRTSS